MVEEYQVGGIADYRGSLSHVFVCWYGLWAAGLGPVFWKVRGALRSALWGYPCFYNRIMVFSWEFVV